MDVDCIERLRLQANAVEESGRLLLADCARALRQGTARGKAWDEICMDLSMAREALETAGWWLRKCAEDMEGLNGRDGEQTEVQGMVQGGQGAEEG